MQKSESPNGGNTQPAKGKKQSPTSKPLLVRKLTNLEDLRRVQARLVKEFLAGRIDERVAKTGAYLTSVLAVTLKHLEPEPKPPSWVSELVLVSHEMSEEDRKFIDEMNSDIMDPPEDGYTN